ncbi:MAG TPA: carbon-nitrogen hydrolase [Myxococcota bacterium]|nr:carbon-nitrogen hydrolase [Myxococcota bacterium]
MQSEYSDDAKENIERVINYLSEAKKHGAQVVCTSELFLNHYFCKTQDDANFLYAMPVDNPYLKMMQQACKKLDIVAPFSFFEKDGPHYYNSVIIVDADGTAVDIYRKSHIPDGPGYQEKYYFRPGNTGFKVFNTKYAAIGVGICWDQWFPEAARIMTLMGAELLLYPTAIGSEPNEPGLSTKAPWQRVMKGHAVANMIPVASANRLGDEQGQNFYGGSFICDEFGEELASSGDKPGVAIAEVDLAHATKRRNSFGFFRDRRVDLYESLLD